MSLIHEALERLEREKEDKAPPLVFRENLENRSLPPPAPGKISSPRSSSVPPRLIYGIGAALVALFVLGLVCLLAGTFQARPPKEDGFEKTVGLPASQNGFSLTGITRVGEELTAIVNNELVRVGDGVGGARVKAVTNHEVVLENGGREMVLSL